MKQLGDKLPEFGKPKFKLAGERIGSCSSRGQAGKSCRVAREAESRPALAHSPICLKSDVEVR